MFRNDFKERLVEPVLLGVWYGIIVCLVAAFIAVVFEKCDRNVGDFDYRQFESSSVPPATLPDAKLKNVFATFD